MSVINASCRISELATPEIIRSNVPSAALEYVLQMERQTPADRFPLEVMLETSELIEELGIEDLSFSSAAQRYEENVLMRALTQNPDLDPDEWMQHLRQEREKIRASACDVVA